MDVRAFLESRWELLRPSFWRIGQASVAAALAWWLARQLPHHPQPFFAPIAAVVAMGAVPGTRGRFAFELILGVALGIGCAALVVHLAGPGTWQLGVAAALGMTAGVLIGNRPVVTGQAAASAVLLIALHRPGAAPGRLLDALIGGGVAIVLAQVLFPIDPLSPVAAAARARGDGLARAAEEVAAALDSHDADRGRRALALVEELDGRPLHDALAMARGVVRRAPRRRREGPSIEAYAAVARSLDAAVADARALAGGALRLLRAGETVPPELPAAARELAAALRARDGADHAERARVAARAALAREPSLGLSVFVHAVEAVAVHAERAAAAVADVRPRRRLF